jgi:AcrR family transcriptional regulator
LQQAVKRFILIGMKQPARHNPKKTGRPLSFDRDAALEQAMLLFWRHGYEATSLSDLRSAMGVTQPSIYTAFGDKKQLFLEAVRRYLSGPVTSQGIIEGAATAREAADGLLQAAAIGFTRADTPPGCLLASSAISCSAEAADVQAELAGLRRTIEAQLRGRLEHAVRSGELSADTDAEALAGHVMAVMQGMSTLARDGASREKLMRIADSVMSAWPGKPSRPHKSRF